jgi:anti-anti-sigma regulatory factor
MLGVAVINSAAGFWAIVMGREAQTGGGELRLVMDGTATRRIFKVTGADKRFRIFDSVPDAILAPDPPAPPL